ncbi:hypothetical protein EMQ25_11650 [Arsenicitalea aurantiaca]|uniref:Uncharacterized protein n=1 Tax=Arsenicitalea aurantiaca TaxID=1783274 RepID=A0A433X7B8_9HYPH|nr:hypothetical protein [Arsenicitalea aurantiaca]RUT29987.1 hypothetical protein EMQ25_11650 [Arsenicitalea aurantiaca]
MEEQLELIITNGDLLRPTRPSEVIRRGQEFAPTPAEAAPANAAPPKAILPQAGLPEYEFTFGGPALHQYWRAMKVLSKYDPVVIMQVYPLSALITLYAQDQSAHTWEYKATCNNVPAEGLAIAFSWNMLASIASLETLFTMTVNFTHKTLKAEQGGRRRACRLLDIPKSPLLSLQGLKVIDESTAESGCRATLVQALKWLPCDGSERDIAIIGNGAVHARSQTGRIVAKNPGLSDKLHQIAGSSLPSVIAALPFFPAPAMLVAADGAYLLAADGHMMAWNAPDKAADVALYLQRISSPMIVRADREEIRRTLEIFSVGYRTGAEEQIGFRLSSDTEGPVLDLEVNHRPDVVCEHRLRVDIPEAPHPLPGIFFVSFDHLQLMLQGVEEPTLALELKLTRGVVTLVGLAGANVDYLTEATNGQASSKKPRSRSRSRPSSQRRDAGATT